jgi:hypothetical protein
MADNPYAARPEGSTASKKKNECPADMPRGDSEAERAARQKFWIERGNAQLAEAGKGYLEWKAKDGHYWIEPR